MNLEGMDAIKNYWSKIKEAVESVESSGVDLNKYEIFYRGENGYFETTVPSIFRNGLENEHKIFRELELRYPNMNIYAYILSVKKNSINIMQALLDAMDGKPFMSVVCKNSAF